MSLSGNLGFVPIEEVLRLLTRSRQQGAVEVTGNGLRGRVFVGKGGIDLATTWGDEDLHRHLVNSGFADRNSLRRITSAETTLAAIEDSNQALVDLLREMTVESIFQIAHRGDDFEVHEGVTSPYASPKSFELESLLADAGQREKDWSKVNDVVPDLVTAIKFRRDLGEREEVTVKVDDWKVLSEIGVGSSIREIADQLGTTEFWTARVTARLVKNDLVEVVHGVEESRKPEPEADWSSDEHADDENTDEYAQEAEYAPVGDYEVHDEHSEHSEDHEYEQYAVEAETSDEESEELSPQSEEQDPETDYSDSWWQEPEDEDDTREATGSETPEVVSENLSEMPSVDGDGSDVEEDTEAFLEKVFSELESTDGESEPESEPEEEGHGLLRRRRMGTLRDFSSDS